MSFVSEKLCRHREFWGTWNALSRILCSLFSFKSYEGSSSHQYTDWTKYRRTCHTSHQIFHVREPPMDVEMMLGDLSKSCWEPCYYVTFLEHALRYLQSIQFRLATKKSRTTLECPQVHLLVNRMLGVQQCFPCFHSLNFHVNIVKFPCILVQFTKKIEQLYIYWKTINPITF